MKIHSLNVGKEIQERRQARKYREVLMFGN